MSTAVLRHRGARAGAALALLVVGAATLGPLLVGHDPDLPDYANQLAPPGAGHLLGTDHAGRDQLARTLAGARTSLAAVAVVLVLATVIGLVVGGVAGYVGGAVDAAVARLIDAVLGLPSQVVALAVVGALGVGADNLVLALVAGGWAYPARIARASVLGARRRPYVVAARLAGIPSWRVLTGHILPTTVVTVLVAAATGVGEIVLTLAGLSFLGLGAQPPTAELGQLLADSQGSLTSAPWLLAGPLTVIAATVGASMLLSDALRDTLDPATPRRRWTRVPGRRRTAAAPRPRGRATAAPPARPAGTSTAGHGAVLTIVDLTVTYADGTVAAANVTLTVAHGERLALVGESGCGKTTIARSILGLLPPGAVATGTVQVDGAGPAGGSARRGLVVGYVAQDPYAACDPVRSVRHHVTEAWRAHRRRPPPGEVTRRVAALGVPDAARRLRQRPHQ
ncbi:MAG TPA: ABC transporter permease subunit, partial [Pilimelia sp.]|nr:ABC transporter permease subunit [Pilimelia sp.]